MAKLYLKEIAILIGKYTPKKICIRNKRRLFGVKKFLSTWA